MKVIVMNGGVFGMQTLVTQQPEFEMTKFVVIKAHKMHTLRCNRANVQNLNVSYDSSAIV